MLSLFSCLCPIAYPAPVPSLTLHSSPHVHNSTVSVISSHWATPIPSPSVTKLGSTPSPSTRPALPSPLMNSTTKVPPQRTGSLANLDHFRGIPVSFCPTSLFSPQNVHQQMRRIQSEHGGRLSYLDRLADDEKRKRNGMLVHQESAPAIFVNDGTRTLSVPSPSTLAKLQSRVNEHRIECVDQLQRPSQQPSSSLPSNTTGGKLDTPHDFVKLRQQFISDAKEWSKKLAIPPQQQLGQQGPDELSGEFLPTISTSTSTIGMSMEDQEKLLSQHFEKMQKTQPSPPFSLPHSASISSLSASAAASSSSSSPSRTRSKSPKPSPIQLPSSTTTFSPIMNPSSLYSFMPTTTTLPGLQSPAAAAASNLLFNQTSQYAALLNQYFQIMSSQQSMAAAAGKQHQQQQQPLVFSDPSIIQSLQQALVVLPDGSLAPANLNLDSLIKKDPSRPSLSEQTSPTNNVGSGGGAGAGIVGKRSQSPNSDGPRLAPPPKRRRSSSLPDITQLPSVVDKNAPIQEDRDAEERENSQDEADIGVVERIGKEDGKKRNMPPLNMIHIPKEVKLHDPMLGFPTPPQSSPHFASSPLIPNMVTTMFQPHPMTPMTPGQDSFSHEDIKDLVGETTSVQTPVPASPNGSTNLPPCEY